jgi:hypothetical protein
VSKTISIPEDLGSRCNWRTCRSKCGIFDASRRFCRKKFGCAGLLIPTDSFQRSFSRFLSRFLEYGEDGPHTLLNGGLRRTPITLTWNCCRDLLNLCLQYLIEAQLVLRSYCEVVHYGIDVVQELVHGMNPFANFVVYPYLIPDDISKRGLISVEILPITTLLVVVERETGLVPPSIKVLIRTKTIMGITNEVAILGDHRVVDVHVAYFSTLFTRYSGIDHFEMIEAWVLKLLHKKLPHSSSG